MSLCAQNRRCTCWTVQSMNLIIMQGLNITVRNKTFWSYRLHKPDTLLAFYRKKCLSSRPQKWRKKSWNVHKIVGAHLQCIDNHYAKIWYKGMKTVGVTDCTNQTPPKHFGWKKCLNSTHIMNEKIFIKCAQNRRCTSSMYEQSLGKVWI